MAVKTGVFIEGSYFCEKCYREYDKEGTCKCGGKIAFISMHNNRYLSVWMKSRKVVENEYTKKIEGNIEDNIVDKGETNMSLDDKVKKLRELLEQFPEMANPNDFDNELEKRRKLYKEITGDVESLGNDMENIWAEDAWEKVVDKQGQ